MPSQPLFSMVVTAGITSHKTQADLGADNWIRIADTQFLTKLNVWLADSGWPEPLFIEVCRDGSLVATQTEAPLWWSRVYRDDVQNMSLGRHIAHPRNEFEWAQPLEATQMDIQFRQDSPYPTGTVYKPTENFAFIVEYFPVSLAAS